MTTPKHSTPTKYYDELPFPLTDMPRPGFPLKDADLINVLYPVLQGVYGLLTSLSENAHTESNADLHYGTCLLAEQIKLCLHVLDRWDTNRKKARDHQGVCPHLT